MVGAVWALLNATQQSVPSNPKMPQRLAGSNSQGEACHVYLVTAGNAFWPQLQSVVWLGLMQWRQGSQAAAMTSSTQPAAIPWQGGGSGGDVDVTTQVSGSGTAGMLYMHLMHCNQLANPITVSAPLGAVIAGVSLAPCPM